MITQPHTRTQLKPQQPQLHHISQRTPKLTQQQQPAHSPAHSTQHPAYHTHQCTRVTRHTHYTHRGLVDGSTFTQQGPHHENMTPLTSNVQGRQTICLPCSCTTTQPKHHSATNAMPAISQPHTQAPKPPVAPHRQHNPQLPQAQPQTTPHPPPHQPTHTLNNNTTTHILEPTEPSLSHPPLYPIHTRQTYFGLVDGSTTIQQRPHHRTVSIRTGNKQGRGTVCLPCSCTTTQLNITMPCMPRPRLHEQTNTRTGQRHTRTPSTKAQLPQVRSQITPHPQPRQPTQTQQQQQQQQPQHTSRSPHTPACHTPTARTSDWLMAAPPSSSALTTASCPFWLAVNRGAAPHACHPHAPQHSPNPQ